MVFAELRTIKSDMSSNVAGGGSFANLNHSVPQTGKFNTQANSSTTNTIASSSTEIPLPTYDVNDPRSILKALIRFIMRTFYDFPKSLVIEYIYHYERIKQQDLADRLCLDPKTIRSYIQEFKRDKFIIEDHRLESNDGTTGRRNQDQYYYKIDTTTFINVVKYRLIHMQRHVEEIERKQVYQQTNYACQQCGKEYTDLDIKKLFDKSQQALICLLCGDVVTEDNETKEPTTTTRQVANMSLFNEQMKTLFQILERIDEIMTNDQKMKNAADSDLFQSGFGGPANHNSNKEVAPSIFHRSQASNVFDRATTINHDIQIIIEKDDDDHYSPMDTDETSNTDSAISSSRGPGKPGKKSTKSTQSAAEVAAQPLSTTSKVANKKVPYEPKPLPHWFVRSTVFVDQDEEHRLNNSASNSSTFSRQLSNQKLVKSTTIQDIKQMLLIYESRKNKTLPLTTMEDSSSPPTPLQITKTTDSQ